MTFDAHLTEFAGRPSVTYLTPEGLAYRGERARWNARRTGDPVPEVPAPDPAAAAALAAPGSVAWRLDLEYWDEDKDQPLGYFTRFTEDVDPSKVAAVVIGNSMPGFEGEESEPIMRALPAIAPRLTALRALFYADLTYQECEASWLSHGDMAPVLAAFPRLEEFADLEPVLSGRAFPRLRSLGLRNAEEPGMWIRALADAPVTPALHTLDLSRGALRDEDAAALLDAPAFRSLRRLDLHHHYLSEEMVERVRETFTGAGVEVDLSERLEPDDDRYGEPLYFTAVGE